MNISKFRNANSEIEIIIFSQMTNWIANNIDDLPTVDNYMMFCFQNNEAGTVGIAWGGVTCDAPAYYQLNINEYFGTDSGKTSLC